MGRDAFLERLRAVLSEISGSGRTIETLDECPAVDMVLRMPCYTAFFVVIERAESLVSVYREAQAEIIGARSTKGAEWPRDLNLVLLIAGNRPPDSASKREIVDDRYVCRKFVLGVNDQDIRSVLANLPFGPPGDLFIGPPVSAAAGVLEAVRGYDPRLIYDLASHTPGAERVFKKILEQTYSLTGEPSASKAVPPSRAAPSVRKRLEGLDITDFRGIRRLQRDDMPLSGDVVFIYGANGVGKTSIADAVEWAITGQVDRLEQRPSGSAGGECDPIINLFSDEGEARVTCFLSNDETVSRLKRGRLMKRLIGSSREVDDRAIIDYVVGTKALSRKARLRIEQLRSLFRGSHMLSQHDIRQFLERTKPVERFDILTTMIGAEEFVRFREKVSAVLRHLRSHAGALPERRKLLARDLEEVSTRLRERRKAFETLSHAVAAGKTPSDLASELLQGLRSCQCSIDEAAFQRADDEPAEHWFEFIAVQAETVIRGKKVETEDLLVRLKSLEQQLPGYVESRTRCEKLAADIAKARSLSEKMRVDLRQQEKAYQDIQGRLQALRTKQSEATRRYADLTWLNENLPAYRQGRETLRRTDDSLAGQREALQKSEAALEDQQESLRVKQARLQEIEQTITTTTNRDRALVALLKRLPDVQARRQEAAQLGDREKQLDARVSELRRQVTLARGEMNAARAHEDELLREYDSEAALHDVLSSFLARIGELVRSAECPLCGRDFVSPEEAKDTIRQHLSAVPIQLRDLARALDEAKKAAEIRRAKADSIEAEIRAIEAELEEIASSKTVATKAVQDFLAACGTLAINVSVEDAISWQNALEEAKRECGVAPLESEVASLRDTIKSLAASLVQQQNVLDGLRRKLAEDEKRRGRLITEIRGLEADMVERGFKPGSLPQDDRLAAELSTTQYEARECGESVAGREAESRDIESAIVGLQESLRRASEDLASKETQFRQYETACTRFVAACRALDVDPESPGESIRVVNQRLSELKQSLSSLEEKRQILQQVVGLGGVKQEVDSLARAEDDVKRQTAESLREESRLREWASRIKDLETDVVRRQIDVIATHLQNLEPTTQRLYQRLNAHPVFGNVRIKVDEKTRELDVEAEASVARERLGDIAVPPSAFFSDAQMNSLAITVFLAGALRQRWSGFNTILIDDPVQQMDEMNVYAFLDLVRGLASHRQFIIFTCSRDFYLLALDKLDCLNKSNRGSFLAYRLEGIAPSELKVYRDAP